LDTRGPRYDWHVCPCCVGNIPRVLLSLPTWTYVKGNDGIYVNLFIGSTATIGNVAGTDVELVQTTDYPWNGHVSIVVNPAKEKEFSIRVRVPNRSVGELYTTTPDSDGIASISVNGTAYKPRVEKGYAIITRTWKAGDRIDLTIAMRIQRIKGSEKIEATSGRVALRYGPLIYCAEAVDQDVNKILSPDSGLTARWEGDLLGGVTVLKGAWTDDSELMAIPYYARRNRGSPADPAAEGATGSSNRRSLRSRAVSSRVWLKNRQ